jgi:hypothetical protein
MSAMSALSARPLLLLRAAARAAWRGGAAGAPGLGLPRAPRAAAPRPRALATALLGDDDAPSTSAAAPAAAGAAAAWRPLFRSLLERLHAAGHFSAAGAPPPLERLEADAAVVKRAVLAFARARPDALAALDAGALAALVRAWHGNVAGGGGAGGGAAAAGLGRQDRKARNAAARLEASVLRGADLPEADGGAADLQDVLRLLLALDAGGGGGGELDTAGAAAARGALERAAAALLPGLLEAAARPAPEGAAPPSARAVNMARLKGGSARPGPRRETSHAPWRGAAARGAAGSGGGGGEYTRAPRGDEPIEW